MSLNYITVKLEPNADAVFSDENTDDSMCPKQALDLSKRNTSTSENTGKPVSADIQPEFVNIKTEIELNCVKEEPTSDSEDAVPSTTWPKPQSIKSEPISSENGRTYEISVKHEPIEVEFEHHESADPKNLLLEKPNAPDSSNVEVTEAALNVNAVDDGKYMCPICQKRFASKSNVQRHQALHNREKLECPICSRGFIKEFHLKNHILSHSNRPVAKTYDCEDCGKQFNSTSNLGQHKRTHLVVKPYQCDICKRQFSVKHNYLKHQGKSRCKVPIDRPLVCHVCNKVFKRPYLLQSHLRKHTTEKPYTCELCSMNFKHKSTLIRHMQLHNGIKPYSCKICSKQFTSAGLIKPHMRKHTGEKPYACPICNRMFAHKHNMERHSQGHSKVKHLDCNICQKRFPKESRLRYHMRIHTNEKPFDCKYCPKKFSHKQNAIRHYMRKHPGAVYDNPKTDASVAHDVWESVLLQNSMKSELVEVENSDSEEEYVLP